MNGTEPARRAMVLPPHFVERCSCAVARTLDKEKTPR
jgi:hypothetical protein